MIHRVELPDGQWAELTPRLNHAQRRMIQRGEPERVTAGLAAMLVRWHVLDVDGVVIPVPADRSVAGFPPSILDTFPIEIVDTIALEASNLIAGDTVPKAGAGTSDGSAPGSGSESGPSSQTPTSLPTIPAGPTPISNLPRTG